MVDDYLPAQANIRLAGRRCSAAVTTEDPEKGLPPTTANSAYRSAAGAGIRLDAGMAYAGAVITLFYDSLLVWSPPRPRS